MKKTLKIVIICLAIFLILGGASFAGLYFYSDLFKSNKELFFKYAKQVELESFTNKEFYAGFSDKLESSTYEDNTKINIDIATDETIKKEIDITRKIDRLNEKNDSEVSVKDNGENQLTLKYLRNGDLYGVLIKDVLNQYIVLENNNLKEFAEKIGITDTSKIPNKLETTNIDEIITEEEMDEIYQKYGKIIIENIPEECYLKVKKENVTLQDTQVQTDGYRISIKANYMVNILRIVAENLRSDAKVFNIIAKVNPEITMEQYQQKIDKLLDSEIKEYSEEENIEVLNVTTYKKIKKLYVKVGIYGEQLTREKYMEMSIEKINGISAVNVNLSQKRQNSEERKTNIAINKKVNTEEQESWTATIESKSGEKNLISPVTININRKGRLESPTIINEIELTCQDEKLGNIKIAYSNTIEFRNDLELDNFESKEYVTINDLTKEEIENLFTGVGQLLSEKTEDETVYIYALIGLVNAAIEGAPCEQATIDLTVGSGIILSVSLSDSLINNAKKAIQAQEQAIAEEEELQEIYQNHDFSNYENEEFNENTYNNYSYDEQIDYDNEIESLNERAQRLQEEYSNATENEDNLFYQSISNLNFSN